MTIARPILIALFLLGSAHAQDLRWPKAMHTSFKINKSIFRNLNNYFERLQRSKAVHWLDENQMVVYEGAKVIFNAKLTPMALEGNSCDSYQVTFSGREGQTRGIRVNTCPILESALTLKSFLRGSFLPSSENYQIVFNGWNYSIVGRTTPTGKQTVYSAEGSRVRIILNEKKSEERLFSELYYSCADCDGDSLVALLTKTEVGSLVESFFGGHDGRSIDARDFYEQAGGYLWYPLSFMSFMISNAQADGGWPEL